MSDASLARALAATFTTAELDRLALHLAAAVEQRADSITPVLDRLLNATGAASDLPPADPHPDCRHEWHGADGGRCPGCGWDAVPVPAAPVDVASLRELAGALNRQQAKHPHPNYVGFGDSILAAIGEPAGYMGRPLHIVPWVQRANDNTTGAGRHVTTIEGPDSAGHWEWHCLTCPGNGTGYELAAEVLAAAAEHGPLAADSLIPADDDTTEGHSAAGSDTAETRASEPRTWRVGDPEPPMHVERVRDANGYDWLRVSAGSSWWRHADIDETRRWDALLGRFGPVREVSELARQRAIASRRPGPLAWDGPTEPATGHREALRVLAWEVVGVSDPADVHDDERLPWGRIRRALVDPGER